MSGKSVGRGKVKIGTFQGVILSLGLTSGTLFMVVTREIGATGGYDTYIATPAAYLLALVVVMPAFLLFGRFPGKRIGTLSCELLGPLLGKGLALLTAIITAMMAAVLIRNGARFITTTMMQETPIWFIMFMSMLVVLYAIFDGIEVLARTAQVLYYLVGASIVFLALASIRYVDMTNLLPLFSRGIGPYMKSALPIIGFAGEYAVLATVLAPELAGGAKKAKTVALWGWLLGGLLISGATFVVQGTFGPHEMVKFTNPPFELAKIIQLGGVSQGVEALLVTAWMVASFLEVSIYYYISTQTLTDAFGEPFEKAWIFLLAVPVFVIGFLIEGQAQIFELRRLLRYYALLPLGVGSYVLLGLVAALRGRLKKPMQDDGGGKDGE